MSLLDVARAPSANREPLLHLAYGANVLRDMPPRAPALADALVGAAIRDLRDWARRLADGEPLTRVVAAFCLLPTTGPASKILAVAHALYAEYRGEVEDGEWTDAAAELGAESPEEGGVLVALYLASMRLLASYVADADEELPDDLPELDRAVRALAEGAAAFRAETGFLGRVRGNWERAFPDPYLHPRHDVPPEETEARRAREREKRAARKASREAAGPAKKPKSK